MTIKLHHFLGFPGPSHSPVLSTAIDSVPADVMGTGLMFHKAHSYLSPTSHTVKSTFKLLMIVQGSANTGPETHQTRPRGPLTTQPQHMRQQQYVRHPPQLVVTATRLRPKKHHTTVLCLNGHTHIQEVPMCVGACWVHVGIWGICRQATQGLSSSNSSHPATHSTHHLQQQQAPSQQQL